MNTLGSNRVFVNDADVIEIVVNGDQNVESVQAMGDIVEHFSKQHRQNDKPVLVLDNLIQIGKVPPEGRRRVVELAKTIKFDKLAFYGKNTMLRLGSNLMMRAIGKGDKVKYFDDYDQALAWLKAK